MISQPVVKCLLLIIPSVLFFVLVSKIAADKVDRYSSYLFRKLCLGLEPCLLSGG